MQTAEAPVNAAVRTIVDIQQLRKSYGSNEVLKGIDLQVKAGEVIAIIGKSGSGKSTLLRCINGLEVFQSGALTVDGKPLLHKDATAMRELRQRVGMIFQNFNLFPHLSVGRNVMLAPSLVKKTATAEGTEIARQLLQAIVAQALRHLGGAAPAHVVGDNAVVGGQFAYQRQPDFVAVRVAVDQQQGRPRGLAPAVHGQLDAVALHPQLPGLQPIVRQHCRGVHANTRGSASSCPWRWMIKARLVGMQRLRMVMADCYII